jgi:mRNA interferase RelE/StbE
VPNYIITFARSALKDLEQIDRSVSRRIIKKIEQLKNNPRPPGCVKLSGSNDLWRIRIGDYRHQKDVYR